MKFLGKTLLMIILRVTKNNVSFHLPSREHIFGSQIEPPAFLWLTTFEIQKYYQNKIKFNSAYSRNNVPKTKDGAYVTNLDEHKSIGAHWIALYVNGYVNVNLFL